MYTQCPECGVAFRVTAEVLKQAAGKVRCGGCGIAFNALAHLSEQEPAAPVSADAAPQTPAPELKPDTPIELDADTPPQSISAEQSAALLKTLDELAGPDVRIEDTGVEWRVLNADEDEDEEDSEYDESAAVQVLEESFKPIDEVITDSAGQAEAPEEIIDEMRFDDNTPLPDDFDFDSTPAAPAPPTLETPEPVADPADSQVDLAFGEPDEWEDLLGDLHESVAAESDEPEEPVAEPIEAETPIEVADDVPPDMDTQFAIQAEAMGIDLSGMHQTVEDAELVDDKPDAVPEEIDRSETTIEEDLIAAAFETEAAVRSGDGAAPDFDLDGDEPAETEEEEPVADEAITLEELDEELGLEHPDEHEELEATAPDEEQEAEEQVIDLELDADIEPEDEAERKGDVDEIAATFDDEVEELIETMSTPLDEEPDIADVSDEHVIPAMTEEEKTINMMIDEELFNLAVEDEEGFASTVVQRQPDKKVTEEVDANKAKKPEKEPRKIEKPPLVETIIMEGESILAESDDDKPQTFDRPSVTLPLPTAPDDYSRRNQISSPRRGMIAGIAALLLLLGLQVIHQSREALATVPAVSKVLGPVYRIIGKPLTPTWDISGWRFEATKGSTDESDELLTIYSRVGNESDEALPYPLVHVSLTDRFEEIIGSRVLDPGEYLAENADPRKAVPPGNTFNAVISIASPSADATGFKLNVCYRLADGQLRCAIEDFK